MSQPTPFNTIGLIGKRSSEAADITLLAIANALVEADCKVLVADHSTRLDELPATIRVASMDEIGEQAELAVVIGGDGNMLGAARQLSRYDIGVIGVNRGNLGFLTDIAPDDVVPALLQVIGGDYRTEFRYLLSATVHNGEQAIDNNNAINEVVLHSDKVAHMIEFEVFVDDQFMYSQRSDGLIVATPTGSTAYSLSAGGPILTPNMDAMVLVPMFPHALSSRPIVIDANSQLRIRVAHNNDPLHISCDGHVTLAVKPGDDIMIGKDPNQLRLIHPTNYNYFHVLRNKLHWGSRLF